MTIRFIVCLICSALVLVKVIFVITVFFSFFYVFLPFWWIKMISSKIREIVKSPCNQSSGIKRMVWVMEVHHPRTVTNKWMNGWISQSISQSKNERKDALMDWLMREWMIKLANLFQWRRQRSKEARSCRGQQILQPGHPDALFFLRKVDDLFLVVALKTQASNAVSPSK